ncbi:MAG: Ldh family oxidoreductase [Thermodesulfobacteriota bacterium]
MKLAAADLETAIAEYLMAVGAEVREARLVADVLLQADMRGIHTHGCVYLPIIAERIKHSLLTLPTRLKRITDDKTTSVIDGNNGLGQVAAAEAMNLCIHKAGEAGVAVVLVRNTNNIGFLGYYSTMAAAAGMVGICMTNAAAAIAPWGGAEALFGTNPLSVAVPVAGSYPIVLDMSSSVVARGKIRNAQRQNKKIPEGWALDAAGVPTTDPSEALKGTVQPIAGPKGYGLALIVDILCGLLSGSKYGPDLLTFHEPQGPTGVGATVIAIDIARFMPPDRFGVLAADYARTIRDSKKAKGVDRIFLPGEIEAEKEILSRMQGIEVDSKLVEKINLLLEEKNLSFRIEGNRS